MIGALKDWPSNGVGTEDERELLGNTMEHKALKRQQGFQMVAGATAKLRQGASRNTLAVVEETGGDS